MMATSASTMSSAVSAALATCALGGATVALVMAWRSRTSRTEPAPLLECIRARKSVFPRSYVTDRSVPKAVVDRVSPAAHALPIDDATPLLPYPVAAASDLLSSSSSHVDAADA